MADKKIEFGTTLRSVYNIAKLAKQIEDLGYDFLGCGEHVSFHGETANGLVSLSVAAGATERIRLMSAITLVPLYPAALLAKMGAALDVASNGRYTTLKNFSLKPLPIQKPHPPIWVSGRTDAAMKRAAKYGDGWLPYMYTPEHLANSIEKIKAFGEEVGTDLSDFTFALYIFSAVHEDRETAVKYAAERLSKQYAQDFSQLVHKYALAGDPDTCKARLQEYIDAGASAVFVSSACPDDYIDTNLEMLAKSVIPAFR